MAEFDGAGAAFDLALESAGDGDLVHLIRAAEAAAALGNAELADQIYAEAATSRVLAERQHAGLGAAAARVSSPVVGRLAAENDLAAFEDIGLHGPFNAGAVTRTASGDRADGVKWR